MMMGRSQSCCRAAVPKKKRDLDGETLLQTFFQEEIVSVLGIEPLVVASPVQLFQLRHRSRQDGFDHANWVLVDCMQDCSLID